MTSTLDPFTLDGCDDPAGLLAYARAQKRVEDDAAREVLKAAAKWASMHSEGSLVGPVDEWHESCLPLGGEGCPEVAEFAIVEFAAAMGRSTESGRRYLSHAVEGCYRLPRCWARVESGELPAWRLGFIAERTICLSSAAAGFVDAKVASFAHSIGPGQLGRLIEEAKARFDPDETEAELLAAAETRHLDVALAQVSAAGTVHVEGDLDLADAIDFNAALTADAHLQLLLGSTESLDVRRSSAAGNLARAQQTLDLGGSTDPRPKRQVVLHVHLSDQALSTPDGKLHLARVANTRSFVDADQVRTWCGVPGTTVTVRPVLDLAEHLHVDQYQVPDRLADQAAERDLTCVFPWCTRPAEECDTDHVIPYSEGGETASDNLAPLCRRHHRLKTHHGRWGYTVLEPGCYLWHSPHGYQFLRDHRGTTDVTRDRTTHPPDE